MENYTWIIWVLLGLCVVTHIWMMFKGGHGAHKCEHGASDSKKSLTDPVCHMQATNNITKEYRGQTYGFCSEHCKQQFEQNPDQYAA